MRAIYQKKTVSDLVYQYLENLANVNERRLQRRNARNIFHRAHIRKNLQDIHPNSPLTGLSPEIDKNFKLKVNSLQYLPPIHKTSFSKFQKSFANRGIVNDYAKAIEGRIKWNKTYTTKNYTVFNFS